MQILACDSTPREPLTRVRRQGRSARHLKWLHGPPSLRAPPQGHNNPVGAVVIAEIALTSAAWHLSAQQLPSSRLIYVNVTDSANRFVTGLEREHFEVLESGTPRPITSFSGVDTPISIAI